VTVGGIGERAGNAPLEETVLALRTLYDLDIGVRTEKLTSLHRLVMELSGVSQPSNRPVTGTRLFDVESGIISTWIRNVRDVDLTEAFPYLPGLVGQSDVSLVLGKGSGLDSVVEALEKVGMTATPEEVAAILVEVKAASLERKRLLELDEFERIARSIVGRAPAEVTTS
jgi:isopropylmalate/homocitrate/citramalate synthase